ncbi:MAG: hypothetical protein EON95_11725, partial [Caulobacteraceae bacterium]
MWPQGHGKDEPRLSDETPRDEDEPPVEPVEGAEPEAETPDGRPLNIVAPDAPPEDVLAQAGPDDPAEGHALTDDEPEPPSDEAADEQIAPGPQPEPPLAITPPPAPAPRRVRPAKPVRKGGAVGRLLRRVVMLALVVGVLAPLTSTLIFRFVPPPVTILMVQRLFEGKGLDRRWMPLSRMSPALPNAVIAAEDARYCSHWGFDFQAMEKAMAHNQRRPGRIRGGSTISQQTAKNVFLWPQRSYVRKGLEAYFTVLIETLWGKRRIMEV